MSRVTYGWTSKAYPFGNPPGGSAPAAVPSKLYATASYEVGEGERVVIKVTLGQTSAGAYVYRTLLDVERTAGVLTHNTPSLLDQEISVTDLVPSGVADWALAIKAEIHADPTTETPFTPTETVTIYTYRNQATGLVQAFLTPPITDVATAGVAMSEQVRQALSTQALGAQWVPLSGVQVQFRAKGTLMTFGTVVTAPSGAATITLPPGSYDVYFTGHGFNKNSAWTGDRAITVGVSDTISRFGTSASTVASNAEFTVIKDRMASTRWIGVIVPEDFTAERGAYGNVVTDPAYAGSDQRLYDNLAYTYFGRMFRGTSWIEFIGIGTDPIL